MKDTEMDFLRRMVIRYKACTEDADKNNLKNEIYKELLPYMKKWIATILSKKGVFYTQPEILSKSWDCFEFCLKKYNPDNKKIPIANHFYKYTEYHLKQYSNDKEVKISPVQFDNIGASINSNNLDIYVILDELKVFREMLDDAHALVFDDALMSLIPSNKNKQYRVKDSSLAPIRYQESKKIFKIIITFLLKR